MSHGRDDHHPHGDERPPGARGVFETAHVIPASDGTHSIDFASLIPIEGERTWEAMYAGWGCRSLGWDYRVVSYHPGFETPETFEVTFDVKGAGATAEPILAEIARRYRHMTGAFGMVTDSEEFSAIGLFVDGNLRLEKHPWTEAMFAQVEGHPYGEWPEEAA